MPARRRGRPSLSKDPNPDPEVSEYHRRLDYFKGAVRFDIRSQRWEPFPVRVAARLAPPGHRYDIRTPSHYLDCEACRRIREIKVSHVEEAFHNTAKFGAEIAGGLVTSYSSPRPPPSAGPKRQRKVTINPVNGYSATPPPLSSPETESPSPPPEPVRRQEPRTYRAILPKPASSQPPQRVNFQVAPGLLTPSPGQTNAGSFVLGKRPFGQISETDQSRSRSDGAQPESPASSVPVALAQPLPQPVTFGIYNTIMGAFTTLFRGLIAVPIAASVRILGGDRYAPVNHAGENLPLDQENEERTRAPRRRRLESQDAAQRAGSPANGSVVYDAMDVDERDPGDPMEICPLSPQRARGAINHKVDQSPSSRPDSSISGPSSFGQRSSRPISSGSGRSILPSKTERLPRYTRASTDEELKTSPFGQAVQRRQWVAPFSPEVRREPVRDLKNVKDAFRDFFADEDKYRMPGDDPTIFQPNPKKLAELDQQKKERQRMRQEEEEKAAQKAREEKLAAERKEREEKEEAERQEREKREAELRELQKSDPVRYAQVKWDSQLEFLGLRKPTRSIFTPLTDEWKRRVMDSPKQRNVLDIVGTAETYPLRGKDFGTVVEKHQWLNDEMINATLQLLAMGVNEAAGVTPKKDTPKMAHFNSFFYQGLKGLEKWPASKNRMLKRTWGITPENFLDIDFIAIPINIGNSHWVTAHIRPTRRQVAFIDSMDAYQGQAELQQIRNVFLKGFLGERYKDEEWQNVKYKVPKQRNGYDCGMFVITNTLFVSLGFDPSEYKESDMSLQRERIVATVLNGGFKGDFSFQNWNLV